jgi:hypothetical protein
MPLIHIAAGIVAAVAGWQAYWWHLDQRAHEYMKPGVEYFAMRDIRGFLEVCESKDSWKCFRVGLWGKPDFGTHQD